MGAHKNQLPGYPQSELRAVSRKKKIKENNPRTRVGPGGPKRFIDPRDESTL